MFIPPNVSGPTPHEEEERRQADPRHQLDAMAQYVVDCLNHRSKPSEIRASLAAKGLTPEQARSLVQQVMQAQAGVAHADAGTFDDEEELALLAAVGRRNMAVGGLFFGVGLVITLISLGSIQGGGGGVIAWGAIIFGGLQLMRGMGQVNAARR
jgi:hypothetical protein